MPDATLNVLVWGTAEQGACAYFRGHMYDEPLRELGIETRHLSNVKFKPAPGWEDKDPTEAVLAGKMLVDVSDLEWADVVVFRRYYNTSIKCEQPGALNKMGCGFYTRDLQEAVAHEHPVKRQDDITRVIWPVVRDHWTGGIVYETDDNHWQIKPWNGYYKEVTLERDLIAEMARRADLVTVSTPPLAAEYGRYNPRIRVIRNAIDPDLYVKDTPRPEGDKPRLVYYGSTARMRDYAGRRIGYGDGKGYAYEAVEASKKHLTRVFLGTDKGTENVIARLFDEQHPYISNIAEFSKGLANSHGDIGLAPLGGDEFDRGKSELHWLEYAMTDMAFIGQRFAGGPDNGPYNMIREGVDGLLARGSQEWHDAVKRLATSPALREDLAAAAKERVLRDYDYRKRAEEWADAFRWAAENAGIGQRQLARAA